MSLMLAWLMDQKPNYYSKHYQVLLIANLISAYGMLIGFTLQGYAFCSILFSTLSIFVSWIFGWLFWKDLQLLPDRPITGHWFKAALFLMPSLQSVLLHWLL